MKHFNFQLVYESDWYIELLSPDMAVGISFTLPQREAGEYYNGRYYPFYGSGRRRWGAQPLKGGRPSDSPGYSGKTLGERSFVMDDPNGIHLYIYKSIPPTPEYQKSQTLSSSVPRCPSCGSRMDSVHLRNCKFVWENPAPLKDKTNLRWWTLPRGCYYPGLWWRRAWLTVWPTSSVGTWLTNWKKSVG